MSGRWSRRRFLAGLAAASVVPGGVGRRAPISADTAEPLRIGVLAREGEPTSRSLAAGIEQGAIEARRAADLLGRGIEIHRVPVAGGTAREAVRSLVRRSPGVHAVLASGEDEETEIAPFAADLSVVHLNPTRDPGSIEDAGPSAAFHVAPSVEERVRALVLALAPVVPGTWRVVAPRDPAGERLRLRIEAAVREGGGTPAPPLDPTADPRGAPSAGASGPVLVALRGPARDRLVASLSGTVVADAIGEDPFPGEGASRFHASTWDPAAQAFGAGELNERFRRRTGAPMDGPAWSGWFAVKALWETWLRVTESTPAALARGLATSRGFDGHKGVPLGFDRDRRLHPPLVVLETLSGGLRRLAGTRTP